MFKLKEVEPWEKKRKEAIRKLINEGEKFKDKSVEKWKKKRLSSERGG